MYKDLMSLLASALNENRIAKLSEKPDWDHIISTAKRHNLLSALYLGINKLPDDKKPNESILLSLQQNYYNETRRSIIQLYEAERIQEAFEQNSIYSLAMKGCNTKLRYPDQTMRSMGDIDLLIKASQNKEVYEAMQELGYDDFEEGRKHDHYRGGSTVGIEMHRELVTPEMDFYSYYSDIWNKLTPKENNHFTCEMTIEDEYIYNIAHLIQHFKLGGIGIRFIMDVYVYNRLCEMDHQYIDRELVKLGIKAFVDNLVLLADGWFGGKHFPEEKKSTLNRLSKYIINGGTFGSSENASALQTSNGKLRYVINFCFPSYASMVSLYPWLEGKRYLLPFSWIHRGVKALIFRRRHFGSVKNVVKNADNNRSKQLKKFYSDCGLEL